MLHSRDFGGPEGENIESATALMTPSAQCMYWTSIIAATPTDARYSRGSEIAGVTVRTLHHYDDIGLPTPGSVRVPATGAVARS